MTLPATCPDALRGIPAWLTWRFEPNPGGGKPRKVPYYAAGGRRAGQQGSPDDQRQMVDFDRALAAAGDRGMDGVGFALQAEHGLCALDFDGCLADGRLHPEVAAVVASSYAEISPSGKGVRAFFRGQLGNLKSHGAPFGFEVFSSKGFVTFTGDVLPLCEIAGNDNHIAVLDQPVVELAQRRFRRAAAEPDHGAYGAEPVGLSSAQILTALAALPAELDYDQWILVGMALHHETSGDGFAVWDEWSTYSPKYTNREYGLERWNSFGKSDATVVTARSLVHLANQHGADIQLNMPATMEDFDDLSRHTLAEAETEAGGADDDGFEDVSEGAGVAGRGSAAADARAGKAVGKRPRFEPVPLALFAARPAPTWIVKGVIPRAELVVLFGESGSGKSFMALDLAACIARGLSWRGRRVNAGRVVYIAAEGAGGFRNRVVALVQAQQLTYADLARIDIIDAAPNMLLKDDALDVAKAIGRADLVIVDTWAQVTAGGNENAGEDMGKALSHCKGIHRATGATVLLVHHSGKDASKGARGWSGLRAAADAELEVVRLANGRILRTSKQKDGDDGLEWGFGLDVITIGEDVDGDAITSCVVTEQEVPSAKLVRVLGVVESVVNDVLQEFALSQRAGIEITAVVIASVAKLPPPVDGKRDTRKQRVLRAIDALCAGDDSPYYRHDDATIEIV